MGKSRLVGRIFAPAILLSAFAAFAYFTDNAVYGPPADYLSPQLPPRGSPYRDPVFNPGDQPPNWIWRLSDATNTPRVDGVPGNVPWVSQEYSTTSPFNSDNTRVLLIHLAYFALYDTGGNLIRNLLPVCASCAPRWSRTDPNVFYYFRVNQIYSYNAATDVHTRLGPPLPYDSIYAKGEDDICFDGEHLIGFGKRGDQYFIYVFSITLGINIAEYQIGGSTDYNNIDSAEMAPDDIVIVSYYANDGQNSKSPKKGIWAFTINLAPLWQIYTASGHHDVGRDVDGQPVLVITNAGNFQPLPMCANGIEKVRILNPNSRTCLLPLHWTLAVHVSLPDQTGWAFVSTYAPTDPWYGSLSRKEELFPRLIPSGATWNIDSNPAHSGGKARWSDSDPARMSYVFYGTQMRWIAYKDSSSGIADITVDGVVTSVDLYSPDPVPQSVVFTKQNLPTGFHSAVIDVTDRKNAASSGYKVWIDAIDDDPPWTTYTNEVVMLRLDGGEIRRMTHHRSRPFNTYNYTPRVSVSHDGNRLAFTSNYGLPIDAYTNYVDAYMMDVSNPSVVLSATATVSLGEKQRSEPFIPDVLKGRLRDTTFLYDYLYPRLPENPWN